MPPLLTQDGKTPLQFAEESRHTAIVKTFEDVKAAGGANNWKVFDPAKKGDLTLLNAAIEAGADVEAKDPVRGINRQRPSLHRRFTNGPCSHPASSLAPLLTITGPVPPPPV